MSITVPDRPITGPVAITTLFDRLDERLSLAGWEGEESFPGCYAWKRRIPGAFPKAHYTISFDEMGSVMAFGARDAILCALAHAHKMSFETLLNHLRNAGVALGAAA